MKQLTKDQMLSVVTEASKRMTEPHYSSELVGAFYDSQRPACQFITAHEKDLGGTEGVVSLVFHCALVAEAFRRAGGRVRSLTYEDLDAAAHDVLPRLEQAQLAVHEFIMANVEHAEAQKLVAMIALAIDGAA
ncbi:MAG TPA: hypothetical protein VGG74_29455 [Kofleriaceae bacterium]|jgi:hypothetical protein